ncbi:MAG: Glutamine-scyllo-inositol transaminase [Candidatus Gottesmanbacteria bacterium GW2011_GWA1_34_13]|uniref:Glutamine-scyllo-inositol transaminase n=1 Tax=Candidatus Gottesmanbacteria bacterium GW2011_GWA1_34_13 TaxID=1618434 RepID=A0A0G0D9F1_9BACT|nr:MAG: Glutamine-scyllo-inositol transaminase [Candidatus Gottesmanbacteria bacterium GW2011_GWA1_34_13]
MIQPAIAGGKSVRKNFLVFGKPKITNKEINEVVKTLKSGWLGTGPKTKIFEDNFKKFIGCKYAVALNSCTAGLHLALDVLGIKEGDEVITTPLTFASTANVIVHHQAKPVFVDIDINSWNIDYKQIEKKITKKTKAIIPVHLHGRPCQMDKISQIAKKYQLFVIEDAAHAAESIYRSKKIGTISDFTAFSFYVTKNIMTGEGGMLTTNNSIWAQEARIRSLHGISKDAWKRYSKDGYSPYETLYPGYKYNMMDLVASLGIHQLAQVKQNFKIRQKYWDIYNKAFKDVPELILPAPEENNTTHARHLYAILLKIEKLKISRDTFINALSKEGIGSGVHFTPLHLHKYYRETYKYKLGDFPNAEFVGSRSISLPLSPAMTNKDIIDVINAVLKIVSFYKK